MKYLFHSQHLNVKNNYYHNPIKWEVKIMLPAQLFEIEVIKKIYPYNYLNSGLWEQKYLSSQPRVF